MKKRKKVYSMKKAIQIQYNDKFEDKCEYAALAGFNYIAVNFDETGERINPCFEKAAEDILRILNKNHLTAVQSHLPCYDLRISAEIINDELEKSILNAIKISGAIGVEWCVCHPRTAITDGYVSSKSMEYNKNAILGYIDTAAKSSTKIAVENLPTFDGIRPVMPFYTSDYEDLCILTDSFNSDLVKICWDTGHANLMGFDQAKAIEAIGNRIVCTHIHNNWVSRDDHNPPDNGTIEWDKIASAFKKIQYRGPLTLETHCRYENESLLKSFAKHNYACLIYIEELMK